MTAIILTARIDGPDGRPCAEITRVDVGGGTQVVTVDGRPEERVHPVSVAWHARLLSADRQIPDTLVIRDSYEDAVAVGEKWAARLAKHARHTADLNAPLG